MEIIFTNWILILSIVTSIFNDSKAILCGEEAKEGEFKYLVAISKFSRPYCGGAIIDERHILTAAHCFIGVEAKESMVSAGLIDLIWIFMYGQTRAIKELHRHPKFYPGINQPNCILRKLNYVTEWLIGDWINMQNDIAILTLTEAFSLTGNIAKVPLIDSPLFPRDTPCDYAGWGLVNFKFNNRILHKTSLDIVNCNDDKDSCDHNKADEFCAIDVGAGTCPLKGDSGSPLVCNGYLVGVTSYGRCRPYLPTIFSSVWAHREFIGDVLRQDEESIKKS